MYGKGLHILNAFQVVFMFTLLCAVIEKIRSKIKRKISAILTPPASCFRLWLIEARIAPVAV